MLSIVDFYVEELPGEDRDVARVERMRLTNMALSSADCDTSKAKWNTLSPSGEELENIHADSSEDGRCRRIALS